MNRTTPLRDTGAQSLVRRHLVIGWFALLLFLTLGIALELLHGLKLEVYLDARNHTRRLMWTLAHAHGTLFALIHLAFAATLAMADRPSGAVRSLCSSCLTGALIAMPTGFFLGGVWLHSGDPGLGILLVPVGAALLLIAVAVTGIAVFRAPHGRQVTSESATAGRSSVDGSVGAAPNRPTRPDSSAGRRKGR